MEIRKAHVVYFSGTGTTEKYAKTFANALPLDTDIINLGAHGKLGNCAADDLLVLAAPVFGGRIPLFVWQCLESIQGHDTPTVIMAVFGARDYDDALLEMQTHLAEDGFVTIAAAALVARHSIVTSIAPKRPNSDDLATVKDFAARVASQLDGMTSIQDAPTFTFKGDLTAKEGPSGPVPEVTDDCVECGICADECPVGAIPSDNYKTTDASKCISCMHCIDVCPSTARKVPDQVLEMVTKMLSETCDPEKANEFF